MNIQALSPRVVVDRAADLQHVARTSWGEQAHVRVGALATKGRFTVLDFRAPAGFGPPAHVHQREDEAFEILEGRAVIWTPEQSFLAEAGDFVFLPRRSAHTWRAVGPTPVRFTLTVAPSGFEDFFPAIEARGLSAGDNTELAAICAGFGIDVVGPPISDDLAAAVVERSHREQKR